MTEAEYLEELRSVNQAIEEKLPQIQEALAGSVAKQAVFNLEWSKLTQLITKLENRQLSALASQLEALGPELRTSSQGLKADLQTLEGVARVAEGVAAVAGVALRIAGTVA